MVMEVFLSFILIPDFYFVEQKQKARTPLYRCSYLRNLSCSAAALCATLAGTFSENAFHVNGADARASALLLHWDSTLVCVCVCLYELYSAASAALTG